MNVDRNTNKLEMIPDIEVLIVDLDEGLKIRRVVDIQGGPVLRQMNEIKNVI